MDVGKDNTEATLGTQGAYNGGLCGPELLLAVRAKEAVGVNYICMDSGGRQA